MLPFPDNVLTRTVLPLALRGQSIDQTSIIVRKIRKLHELFKQWTIQKFSPTASPGILTLRQSPQPRLDPVKLQRGPNHRQCDMHTEKPILIQDEVNRQPASEPWRQENPTDPQGDAASGPGVNVAEIDRKLRAANTKSSELITRCSQIVCVTREMISYSKEAIATSRALLERHPDPLYRCDTDIDEPRQP